MTGDAELFAGAASAAPGKTLMVFDFDGTLAPIVPDPRDAAIMPVSAAALGRLGQAGCQIAFISGRPVALLRELADLDRIDGMEQAIAFGQYGAERFDAANQRLVSPPAPSSVGQAKRALQAVADTVPGATVEDKGLAVALHVRNAADPDGAFLAVEGEVRAIARPGGLTVEPGRYVWELRAASVTKGDALLSLVREKKPAAVMYAGDDLGDLPAFKTLDALRSEQMVVCSIVVSSPENPGLWENADVVCEGPEGLSAWLRSFVGRLESGASAQGWSG